jgi:hypothetical protein
MLPNNPLSFEWLGCFIRRPDIVGMTLPPGTAPTLTCAFAFGGAIEKLALESTDIACDA